MKQMVMRTNKIKTTAETLLKVAGGSGQAVTASGWTYDNNGDLFLNENLSDKYAILPVQGLAVGDTITEYHVEGAIGGTSGNASVFQCKFCKVTKGTGVTGSTLIAPAMTALSKEADYSMDEVVTLTSPEVVAADTHYYFLLKGTTANNAACDISLAGITLYVKKTFGMSV